MLRVKSAVKFAHCAPRIVQRDLLDNHGRKVTVSLSLQDQLSDAVATIVQARRGLALPCSKLEVPVKTIAISLDGTCMLMCESGWREAMAGSLSHVCIEELQSLAYNLFGRNARIWKNTNF